MYLKRRQDVERFKVAFPDAQSAAAGQRESAELIARIGREIGPAC
jgi:hypothetical protein